MEGIRSHSNSVFGARAFFQVGGLKPAHDNHYGFEVEAPLWRGAHVSLATSQQKTRGMVTGTCWFLCLRKGPRWLPTRPCAPTCSASWTPIRRASQSHRHRSADVEYQTLRSAWTGRTGACASTRTWGGATIWRRSTLPGAEGDRVPTVAGQNPDTTGVANEGRVTWRRDWTSATSTSATIAFDRTTALLAPSKDNLGPSLNVGGLQGLGPAPDVPSYRADNLFRQECRRAMRAARMRLVFGFEIICRRITTGTGPIPAPRHRVYRRLAEQRHHQPEAGLALIRWSPPIGDLSAGFRNWECPTTRRHMGRAGRPTLP